MKSTYYISGQVEGSYRIRLFQACETIALCDYEIICPPEMLGKMMAYLDEKYTVVFEWD